MSGSVAVTTNANVPPFATRLSEMGANTGGAFVSFTTIVTALASLMGGDPLSVTRMVMILVAGPWLSPGTQTNNPLFASMAAPLGTPGSSVKVNCWAG